MTKAESGSCTKSAFHTVLYYRLCRPNIVLTALQTVVKTDSVLYFSWKSKF